MPDEPKDVRIPLMVTKSDLVAIDEFRFTKRIATRAEAVRRLIQLGLEASGQSEKGRSERDKDD